MNEYQKRAVFYLRLAGAGIAIWGAMGGLCLAIELAFDMDALSDRLVHCVASLAWMIMGVLLIVSAKRVGRLLGRELD